MTTIQLIELAVMRARDALSRDDTWIAGKHPGMRALDALARELYQISKEYGDEERI